MPSKEHRTACHPEGGPIQARGAQPQYGSLQRTRLHQLCDGATELAVGLTIAMLYCWHYTPVTILHLRQVTLHLCRNFEAFGQTASEGLQ